MVLRGPCNFEAAVNEGIEPEIAAHDALMSHTRLPQIAFPVTDRSEKMTSTPPRLRAVVRLPEWGAGRGEAESDRAAGPRTRAMLGALDLPVAAESIVVSSELTIRPRTRSQRGEDFHEARLALASR
jgi:hypothetical protein